MAQKLANEEVAAAHNFLVCSADYYDDERTRQDAVTQSLETLLRRDFEDIRSPNGVLSKRAAAFSITQSYAQVPLLLFQLKNEIGAGCADPTHQVGLYRKHWS